MFLSKKSLITFCFASKYIYFIQDFYFSIGNIIFHIILNSDVNALFNKASSFKGNNYSFCWSIYFIILVKFLIILLIASSNKVSIYSLLSNCSLIFLSFFYNFRKWFLIWFQIIIKYKITICFYIHFFF